MNKTSATDNRPKVGLGILIVKGNKVLLGQRVSRHGTGAWCPPGGHLEFGESFEDCAKREAAEECGVSIKNIKLITFTNDIHKEEGKHYVTILMIADWSKGHPQVLEPDRLAKWGWFDWDNLPSPLFMPIQTLVDSGFKI